MSSTTGPPVSSTSTSASPQQQYPYTIIFASPGSSIGEFLNGLQISPLPKPLFMGEYPFFYGIASPMELNWAFMMVFEGHDINFPRSWNGHEKLALKMPRSWSVRQLWKFSIDAEAELLVDGFDKGAGVNKGQVVEGANSVVKNDLGLPEELGNVLRWFNSSRDHEEGISVLCFVAFKNDESREAYLEHLSLLQTQDTKQTESEEGRESDTSFRVYLSGPITLMPPMQSFGQGVGKNRGRMKNKPGRVKSIVSCSYQPDHIDHFALMSFASHQEFAKYELSDDRKGLEEKGVKVDMVFTRRTSMEEAKMKHGNHPEPYGQDWFG